MGIKSPGYGRKGKDGAKGDTGPKGDAGVKGDTGSPGTNATNPSFTASANTLTAGASATASVGGVYPNLTITIGVPRGADGSNASATPLATVAPLAPGTATVGVSGRAAREDHIHPLQSVPTPSSVSPLAAGTASAGNATAYSREDHRHPAQTGFLTLVGNVTVTETLLISLGLGMKRMTLPLAGITTADMGKLIVVPNGAATVGCEVQNAYPVSNGNVSIGYYTPALGIAATYTIPVSVYRVT